MFSKYIFNIQAFASVINTSTSSGSGNDLTNEIKTYYSDYLIDIAEGELVHDQLARRDPSRKARARPSSSGSGLRLQRSPQSFRKA